MDILLRSARIIDTGSSFHNTVKDILVSNGTIKKIGNSLRNTTQAHEVKADNLHVSLGWVDMNAFFADPGLEHKETIATGCRAAARGGFTHVCVLPNTQPVTDNKTQIEYVLRKSAGEAVSVHPYGAVTQQCEGKTLAEMYDMHNAGAIAFSDGIKPSPSAGVVERALLYIQAFNGLLVLHEEDKSISKNGVMHEGIESTRAGLPGMPALAEEIAVNRDLYVVEYTNGRLHMLDISVKKSAELIKQAKKRGWQVSCSVNAYNLFSTDTAVAGYDTNAKVNPPFRSAADVNALQKAVADGVIDTITSAHQPHEEDAKKSEFDKAEFGMIGLETAFAIAHTALQKTVSITQLVSLFSENPRRILQLPVTKIQEGERADLTLFNPSLKWTLEKHHIGSASSNTPYIGQTFTGKALGIINNDKLVLNP